MDRMLRNIIGRLDLREPYVWRMRLTDKEYLAVEEYVRSVNVVSLHNPSRETALAGMIYLAEWYRRCYSGAEQGQANELKDADCKKLWEASGINKDIYVYKTEKGISLWKYSIYVLGGLAVRHELSRGDKGRFLKQLCRMFHGEDCSLEELDDESRAFAFRQSIVRKHSLYEYLRGILNGERRREDKQASQLIAKIRSANEEVLRAKFSLDWIVSNHTLSESMSRRLRVWLKPEEVGGGLHQYLRYDRVSIWGITNPESMKSLFFGLRWKRGNEVVVDIDRRHPIIVYSNSGNGFVGWGVEKYAVCRDVPSEEFDRVEIVAFDDAGHEWIVQGEETATWMQLWRMDEYGDEWSSRKRAQRQTAVVYTDEWKASAEADLRKAFVSRKYGRSLYWNWNYIETSVTLSGRRQAAPLQGVCDSGTAVVGCSGAANNCGRRQATPIHVKITLYNQAGYDTVYALLHKETICYHEGGKIRRIIEAEEEEMTEEFYPLIFGKEDLRVMHFSDKDGVTDKTDEECEAVEFKRGGRYQAWTESERPEFGLVDLRVDVKGDKRTFRAIYLKGIERDIERNAVRYYDLEGEERIYQDEIVTDKRPLHPTVTIAVGKFEVDVYRPTDIKEIYLDGKVHAYCHEEEGLEVPYILKDRVEVADFSKDGYRRYSCSRWGSIFSAVEYVMSHIQNNDVWDASILDADAPRWMKVYIAKSTQKGRFIRWNCFKDEEPREFEIPEGFKKDVGDIFLIDMNEPDERLSCTVSLPAPCPPFRKFTVDSELKSFEIAQRYMSYFNLFNPLQKMAQKNEADKKLVAQLMAARGGQLTESEIKGLRRLAEEFNLDADKFIPRI